MINKIRPHRIFDLVPAEEKSAVICLPQKKSLTSMLERGILLSLAKAVKPQRIFEFGTYLGETTFMLAENTEAEVFTLDLGESYDSPQLDNFEKNNLAQHRSNQKQWEIRECGKRVTQLLGDSTLFDFSSYHGSIQFVLIDGGHQTEVVIKDTENALALLDRSKPGCVIWHDYNNPHYEITQYLDGLSESLKLFYIEETKYVVYFNEHFPF
ncbi:Methyltransferase domain-containing protein [Prosthecobacter debontii]|uniref:Methyltransferase domain-containing protein n=1 Tax=Prosthecobacter debontii TaxID=48467 RepID=A0A1T4XTH5_9BACT|nr:class I SAM-dependent methyltransferase [Prosthecobacter debontii]SKA92852.1 Methyltransferase domain-containing protein [Prosthecobacter debontii]